MYRKLLERMEPPSPAPAPPHHPSTLQSGSPTPRQPLELETAFGTAARPASSDSLPPQAILFVCAV